MDLKRLDTIILGVVHGGTVDKTTFQQIASLARRWLTEEARVIELGGQITSGIDFLKQMAEDLVKDHAENRSAMKMIKRYRSRLDAQLTQHEEWDKTAKRQQNLIEDMLIGTSELYTLIRNHLNDPSGKTSDALRDHLEAHRI